MIRCPKCDAETSVDKEFDDRKQRTMTVHRECVNGHTFVTKEVHITMVADGRELRSALNHINRRIALWRRDNAIVRDDRSIEEIAAAHDITPTRVRQIRAQVQLLPTKQKARKIRSSTQKGKS